MRRRIRQRWVRTIIREKRDTYAAASKQPEMTTTERVFGYHDEDEKAKVFFLGAVWALDNLIDQAF